MNIKKIFTCAILLLVLITIVIFYIIGSSIYQGKYAKVTFFNNSGTTIERAIVTVSGKSCSVKKLQQNGEIRCYFENLNDSGYRVEGELIGGIKFKSKSIGYVTGGMNFNHKLTLEPTYEVTIAQGKNK